MSKVHVVKCHRVCVSCWIVVKVLINLTIGFEHVYIVLLGIGHFEAYNLRNLGTLRDII